VAVLFLKPYLNVGFDGHQMVTMDLGYII